MNNLAPVLILICLWSWPTHAEELPQLVEPYDLPEILYSSNPDLMYPVWISADAAFNHDGELNEALFSAPSAKTIKGYLELPSSDGCIEVGEHYESIVDPHDRSSLRKSVHHSELVLQARVTAKEFGFHHYLPGQLLRVEPVETLRGKVFLDHYYIFLPMGEFSAGPHKFCKVDSRYPTEPRVGDGVLLMIPSTFSTEEQYLELQEASSIVVLQSDGGVSFPSLFKSEANIGGKEKILSELREILGKLEGKSSGGAGQ